MRKLKRAAILVLTAALVFGAVPAAVLAGPGPVAAGHGPLMFLGLSDQQLAQIRDLEKHTYNQNRKLKIQMMDAKFALSQLRLQKNVDQAAVDVKVKELQDLRARMKNNGLAARQKLQTILTPEQWNKLQAAGKERHRCGDRPAEPGDGT
ncbi:MAG: Spy/CpxP family protein refolding chaperone [Peptococcaceae bacterium]|jgi:Spy/CpxP family protein refolding chaperone|nr:Spy/CpxP family protein refolding chaperone [Peptococcaceae bacterium]